MCLPATSQVLTSDATSSAQAVPIKTELSEWVFPDCALPVDFDAPSWLLDEAFSSDHPSDDIPLLESGPSFDESTSPSPVAAPRRAAKGGACASGPSKRRAAYNDDEDEDDGTEMSKKEKNRIAARRHRLQRKQREQENDQRLQQLDERNAYLKAVVAQATAEVQSIKRLMIELLRPAVC